MGVCVCVCVLARYIVNGGSESVRTAVNTAKIQLSEGLDCTEGARGRRRGSTCPPGWRTGCRAAAAA